MRWRIIASLPNPSPSSLTPVPLSKGRGEKNVLRVLDAEKMDLFVNSSICSRDCLSNISLPSPLGEGYGGEAAIHHSTLNYA